MKAEVYVGGVHIGTATEVKIEPREKPLPKPPRVEKWQRRRNQGAEYVVESVANGTVKLGGNSSASAPAMLVCESFEFLGYAKPDKVEAGQRWRDERGSIFTATRQRGTSSIWRCVKDGGANDEWLMGYMLEPWSKWEYLGMAESVPEIKRAFATTPNKSRDEMTLAGTSREDSTVRDPKAEARRANEEAAKRLIANPPDWAYPKAWMCAVLAAQEWNNSHTVVPGMELSAIGWWVAVVCELEHRGRERSATIDGIATVVRDAYARGMERHPPMTRQGIKRGISTCDMGGEYE